MSNSEPNVGMAEANHAITDMATLRTAVAKKA